MKQADLPIPDFDLTVLIEKAVETLRTFEPKDKPYYGCFSGGKDSVVVKALASMAGVNVGWHYNVTTIDPPELIKFIRREHSDVKWLRPRLGNFFGAMEKRGFPTRRNRWCCEEYKESNNPVDRKLIMGIRGAESKARAKRWKVIKKHWRTNSIVVSPIFHWHDKHVWGFIKKYDVACCGLYDEGFKRLGCIGCPCAREAGRLAEFKRWPRYERLWMRGFKRIWERRAGTLQRDGREWFGTVYFDTWLEMWEWWLSNRSLPKTDGKQIELPIDAECIGLYDPRN